MEQGYVRKQKFHFRKVRLPSTNKPYNDRSQVNTKDAKGLKFILRKQCNYFKGRTSSNV